VSGADRDALDDLRHDMAEHQKRVGKEPTDAANAALMAPVLEQHDKLLADHERSRDQQQFVPPPRRTEMTIENRVVDDRTYKLKLQPEPERAQLTSEGDARDGVVPRARVSAVDAAPVAPRNGCHGAGELAPAREGGDVAT
jgi:hypothetical protein